MQGLKEESTLLTIKDVARILRISERSIYNQIGKRAKRRFPVKPLRVGGCIRFDIDDLKQYIESLKSGSKQNEKKVKLLRRRKKI
jgi:predicted DNA-binding transcriptional regulator AlpA